MARNNSRKRGVNNIFPQIKNPFRKRTLWETMKITAGKSVKNRQKNLLKMQKMKEHFRKRELKRQNKRKEKALNRMDNILSAAVFGIGVLVVAIDGYLDSKKLHERKDQAD